MKPQEYAQALYEAVSETRPEDQDKVLDNFVKVLSENGDIRMYQEIEDEYRKIEMKAQGIKQVQLTTAHAFDAEKLIPELNKIIGDKYKLEHNVDSEIIGGVVLRVDDTLIDASVKNNLIKLRKEIKE